MKANDFKNYFKKLGIPVRVRTSKHFINVWIEPETDNSQNWHLQPLKYTKEFPLDLRVKLLKAIYGEKDWVSNGNAGNIRPYSLSFNLKEWELANKS